MKVKQLWIVVALLASLNLMSLSSASVIFSASSTNENWWDEFGEPEYGGRMIIRVVSLAVDGPSFDPNSPMWGQYGYWFEPLFAPDYVIDRKIWDNPFGFFTEEYFTGLLAENWELTDPVTYIVEIRKGIHWRDKKPVNGRELTAEDIQYSYDRVLATGSGFTRPHPMLAGNLSNIKRVVAVEKYKVEFRLKTPSAMSLYQVLHNVVIVPPEWGSLSEKDRQEWQNAVGTGPWMPTDFIRGASLILSRNPAYWQYDARHPANRLPYVDTLKTISIQDSSTALAALRTGKLDLVLDGNNSFSLQESKALAKSNPDIVQKYISSPGVSIDLRVDRSPYTDIKVRKALQMAIDRKAIAESYYQGTVEGIPCGAAHPDAFKGWITPYEKWPEDLKGEYGYNPEKAKALLSEAGYPDGFSSSCVADPGHDTMLLQVILSYFKEIGVTVEVEMMDPVAFRPFTDARKHEQMVLSNSSGLPMSFSAAIGLRASIGRGMGNYSCTDDPVYNAFYKRFFEAVDIDEARRAFNEADLYLLRQHWSVQVCPSVSPIAWQPYIKGYSGENDMYSGYYEARMWIDSALKKSMGH